MEMNRANPTPLALFGLGVILVLTGVYSAPFWRPQEYWYDFGMFVVLVISVGALLQLIGGLMHSRRMDAVGLLTFTVSGLFWLAFLGFMTSSVIYDNLEHVGWFLLLWAVLALLALAASGSRSLAWRAVLLTFAVYLLLLTVSLWLYAYWPGDRAFNIADLLNDIARWEGVLCGVIAIYLAAATVVNETEGRTVLPTGPKTKPLPPPPIHQEP